ncbi:myb-binding protein 1A-like protein [Polymixia lowei]
MDVKMGEIPETEPVRPKVTDAKGILQQNREFLDFFWDIAKPEQEIRLKAIEDLVQYLKKSEKPDELDYTLKRLVDGLAHTREASRPGFSLALGQVLSAFDDIPLQTILDRVKDKHNLQTVKKKLLRNAMFGNFFGILALSQSTRLSKEPQVVLGSVQLLQSLSKHREHLKDLPSKTMMDILSETPEEVFEEVLLKALKTDLSSAYRTPEQLQLLLVAMQRFPKTLEPKKLNKLLGTSTIVTAESIPKLMEVLRMAANSVKKECVLPAVALDLLKLSLREGSFQLFWTKAITVMLKDPPGPTHYLSYRLLGSALPLLSLEQLKEVLSGEVMKHYGEHVMSSQKLDRFKLAPEMDTYVADFLQGCEDPDKQLLVVMGFSKLTNQGSPVVPSVWRVVQHLRPAALQRYVDWLKDMFLQPQLESCLDFSTRRQKNNQEEGAQKEDCVFRFRKWIVARLTSIVDNPHVKKEEDLVMDVARFVFFHAFFNAKKVTPDIPETERKLSVPLDQKTRAILISSFFGLLQCMHVLPVLGESADVAALNQRRVLGVTADGTMWIYCLVQYAQVLLNQPKYAQRTNPFGAEQRQAWDSMLESVATLIKKAKKDPTPENNAFQQLFLLVGIHLFKSPEELVDIMKDLQNCIQKAQEKKTKKKKKSKAKEEEEEPHWAEVVVDILLSLLSQPSRHIRHVCKTVFTSICPHITATALTAILDVLDPDKDEEESAVVVTDDKDSDKAKKQAEEEQDEEEMEEEESDDDSDEGDEDEDAMEEEGEVDQNFRLDLMKVLQKQNALATEEDDSDAEDMDDEAMMKLDKSLAALFSEQKKKIQAKKDEKTRLHKEKMLVLDFKIKVLDLVEVFLTKQGSSPLVLGMVEPLLNIVERCMSSESHQIEQDFLRRVADIFRNQLCRSKVYCKTVGDRQGELHDLLEKLMTKAQKQADSSVSLYLFSASLYLVKVLRGGVTSAETKDGKKADTPTIEELRFMGNVDVERVSALFREALCSFMSRRKCPLTGQMFSDLFNRFPVLCVNLMDTAVQNITSGVREHQQSLACSLVLRAMQSREVQQLLIGAPWTQLCVKAVEQLTASLKQLEQCQSKVVQEKVIKSLELCQFLVKHIHKQKLSVDLEPLQMVLQSLTEIITFKKTGQLEDTYWAVMKHFGVIKPKAEKTVKSNQEAGQQAIPKKKKGFLPETKKRKNRKKQVPLEGAANVPNPTEKPAEGKGQAKKKNKNKKKRKQPGEGDAPSCPAKKAKTQSMSKPAKNKKFKQKKQGGEAE